MADGIHMGIELKNGGRVFPSMVPRQDWGDVGTSVSLAGSKLWDPP